MVKSCEFCGKNFFTKAINKKCCSKACESLAAKERRKSAEQPCWSCKNACGKCSWSKNFTPVTGWIAEPSLIKDSEGDIDTYKIIYCPQYLED